MKKGFQILCVLFSFVWIFGFQSFENEVSNIDPQATSTSQSEDYFVQSKHHSSCGVKVNFEFSVQTLQSLVLKKSKSYIPFFIDAFFVSQHEIASEVLTLNQTPIVYFIAFTVIDAIYPFHVFW
jgi:hypothetical protein